MSAESVEQSADNVPQNERYYLPSMSATALLVHCSLILLYHLSSSLSIGYVDRIQLETYENLSDEQEENKIFDGLTFRFSCEGRPVGLYADVDYNCTIFHACDDRGSGFPLLCPVNMFFDQRERLCTNLENIECDQTEKWFHLNELPYSVEVTEEYKLSSTDEEYIPSVVPLRIP